MTVFAGLDLAWTPHHESGLCLLAGDESRLELIALDAFIATPEAFADSFASHGDDVVVAIDAPLLVEPGRTAESELARRFGRYGARAYNANRPFLERMNGLAGPQLAELLRARGFSFDPLLLGRKAAGRFAFEMFPHAFHVAFFGLDHILKYKKGPLRDRRTGLGAYRRHLAGAVARLPLATAPPALEAALSAPLDTLPGAALKRLEDRLDALTCAIAAYEAWRHGVSPGDVFGTPPTAGHIVIPGASRAASCPP